MKSTVEKHKKQISFVWDYITNKAKITPKFMLFVFLFSVIGINQCFCYQWPVYGNPSLWKFGYRFAEMVGNQRHLGVDIILPPMTQISAPADCYIFISKLDYATIKDPTKGYGWYIVGTYTEPDGSIRTFGFGHLSRRPGYTAADVGYYKQGETLGFAGFDDENGTGDSHAHWFDYDAAPDGLYHYYGYTGSHGEDVDYDQNGNYIGGKFTDPIRLWQNYIDPFANGTPTTPDIIEPVAGTVFDNSTKPVYVPIRWKSVFGADRYHIFITRDNPTGSLVWESPALSGNTTSYTADLNLANGYYYIRVNAVNSQGDFSNYETVQIVLDFSPQLEAPVLQTPLDSITFTINTNETVTISFGWDSIPYAKYYVLYLTRENENGSMVYESPLLTVTSHTATLNLSSGTYFWRVNGIDEVWNFSPWNSRKFVLLDPPTIQPTATFTSTKTPIPVFQPTPISTKISTPTNAPTRIAVTTPTPTVTPSAGNVHVWKTKNIELTLAGRLRISNFRGFLDSMGKIEYDSGTQIICTGDFSIGWVSGPIGVRNADGSVIFDLSSVQGALRDGKNRIGIRLKNSWFILQLGGTTSEKQIFFRDGSIVLYYNTVTRSFYIPDDLGSFTQTPTRMVVVTPSPTVTPTPWSAETSTPTLTPVIVPTQENGMGDIIISNDTLIIKNPSSYLEPGTPGVDPSHNRNPWLVNQSWVPIKQGTVDFEGSWVFDISCIYDGMVLPGIRDAEEPVGPGWDWVIKEKFSEIDKAKWFEDGHNKFVIIQ